MTLPENSRKCPRSLTFQRLIGQSLLKGKYLKLLNLGKLSKGEFWGLEWN